MMTSLTLVVLLVGTPCVSAGTKKCKWIKESTECDMDEVSLATIVPDGGDSKIGTYLTFAAKHTACAKLSATKSACEGNSDCGFNPSEGMCGHKDAWNMMSLVYDMSGCGPNYIPVNCQFYTKASCEGAGAPCEWNVNDYYDADADPFWEYSSDFGGCLQKPSSFPGSCSPNGAQVMCDIEFNVSKVEEEILPLFSISYTCGQSANADDYKTCAANFNPCPGLVTDTMATTMLKADKTAADSIALATAFNACVATKSCQGLADVYGPIPLEVDLPDDPCDGHATAEACGAQGNCFWATTGTECHRLVDIRERHPPAECILTKMGKLQGTYFDSDAEMVAHYNEEKANEKHCHDLAADDTCDADAKCTLKSHTPMSCSADGTAETGSAVKSCSFDDDDPVMEKAQNDLMWGEGAVDDIVTIGESCKAFTTETECTGAEMTAEEQSAVVSSMARATADSARPTMTSCPIALWLVGALAWAVSG